MSTYDSQTERLAPQTLLQQRYFIVGQAGRGGMGTVYQATDLRIAGRYVAIKEMRQSKLSEAELAEATARFQQEAAMLGTLSHPNLPRISDSFSEQGRFYLVMDYIEGRTLQQLLKEAQGRPLPVAQVLSYALQLCDVLGYLHRRNPPIIFRDVKPSNVMVNANGQIFLIDFGIARFFKEGQQQDTMLLGSPGYAAPEQHGLSQTNPRTDIYGLGATLHYCLTGRDPYHSKSPFIFPPIRQLNPQVTAELDQLIQRMVAHDEQARPASALEVQQALMTISKQAAENTSALSPALAATQYMPAGAANNTLAAAPHEPTVPVNSYQQTPVLAQPVTTQSTPPSTKSPWNRSFLLLFGGVLILALGCSAYAILSIFNIWGLPNGWAPLVEAGLSFVLMLIAGIASSKVRGFVPRSILVVTGIASLITGIAGLVLGWGDVRDLLGIPPQQLSYLTPFDPLLGIGSTAAAVVSLYWPFRLSSLADRVVLFILFGGATLCALLQFQFGIINVPLQELLTRHLLLLGALIFLIQGILYATRVERIRNEASEVALQRA